MALNNLYTYFKGGKYHRSEYKHIIKCDSNGITHDKIQWCKTHCKHPWAWWFSENSSYIGFFNTEEAVLFALNFS